MTRAEWENTVTAEGDDAVFLEGNCCFRSEEIHWQHLQPGSETTICAWKGTANCYDVQIDGKRISGAACCCADPKLGALEIRDRVAFWKGLRFQPA